MKHVSTNRTTGNNGCKFLRSLLSLKWIVAVCCLLTFSLVQGMAAPEKPNIIIIFTDDMGYADVGCYGGTFTPTPNIDQLAKEGTRFTQFYVASPICSPSRAGLLTGMYPARWKIRTFLQSRQGNRAAGQADFLDPKAPSMVRTLKEAGYATAHIGKWHLGGGRDVTDAPPFSAYGYDEHVSTYESPAPDPALTATNWIWSANDDVKRWDRSAYFVDKTLDFLKRKKDQPCFVNFWPDDVHTPWVPEGAAPQAGRKKHESRREFELVLTEYDRQVGRLMEGLKKLGLDKNTIVIFTSDNGPGPDFAGNPRSLGMRGQKGSLYEGGIRVPFIVRWPGKTPVNRVNDTSLFNAVDLFPSLCKIAGAPLPKNTKLDGEDVSQIFFGKNISRKHPMFWEFNRNKNRNEPANRNHSPQIAIRDGRWKFLVNEDGSGAELYDLKADPNETQNLVKKNQTMTARLTDAALEWKRAMP
ncbi:MAG: sulfatase-like hydrolase/transferase [Verrucomicrobia bacterium]|nr:sulfatase-like hydrolase/transferase [Verrucomicrobiota bacterium]